ncbi:formylglycine-generating enzyme family protein [Engelhardtia mirabilis]|uniref:Serine/threonine-protein kinase pkn1 n=1 Tax=Engelhardtia mirabilis TaxID=2528011 RepID=A0A518BIS0_9BACT|nr:Serine/threonine-protein kinase pkn1 [Planctomycetes bacterium Pla133]QDV01198.1 Serine/threonine-protein kinase pkn1 [Planctomycetes bacterium Pla86]
MSVVARTLVVGLLGLGAGLGGGYWASSGDAPSPALGAAGMDAMGAASPASRLAAEISAREDAERRATAAQEQAAAVAARLRDVSDQLASARAGSELEEQAAALEVTRSDLSAARATLAATRSEAEASSLRLEEAISALESANAELVLSAERRAELERERDAALAENERLADLAAARQLEVEAARAKVEAALARRQALEDEQAVVQERLAEARTERDDLLRLASAARLDELVAELDELWPATPEKVPAMEAWIRAAQAELAGLDHDRSALARLEQRIAAGEASADELWWAQRLGRLVDQLEALLDPEHGALGGLSPSFGWGVARRIAFAETVVDRSLEDRDAREAWAESIRFARTSDDYRGLELEPQLGLLPLGPDPDSGLLEFAWLASGRATPRGPDGRLELGGDSAAVLVLVPGGRCWIGAQSRDRGGPNFDPLATDAEGPPRQVELSPHFIGKHELTQGQWLRLVGENPSRYGPGTWGGREVDLAHPVTNVSWDEATTALARHGLRLPTEAEWECDARAGASTAWSTGGDPRSLSGSVNLADRYAGANGGANWAGRLEWLDDGHTVMARVDDFRANAFGLHHVHGNVWEWCADGYQDRLPASTALVEDPLVDPQSSTRRTYRGGAYNSSALDARLVQRSSATPDAEGAALGLRIARDLQQVVD